MHERILSWVTYFNFSLNYWVTILYIWSWTLRIPVSCSHHMKMHSFLSGDLTLTRYLFPFHPVGSPSHAGWAHQDFLSYSQSVHFPEQMNSVPVLTIFKVSKWRQATLYNGDKLTRHRAQGSGQLEKLESPLRQNNPITLHNLILNHLLNDKHISKLPWTLYWHSNVSSLQAELYSYILVWDYRNRRTLPSGISNLPSRSSLSELNWDFSFIPRTELQKKGNWSIKPRAL